MNGRNLFFFFLFVLPAGLQAQFAPAAGQAGTTAINKDSSAFVSWAVSCKVNRGFINIEDTTETYTEGDTTSNRAFFGTPENAVGKPEGALEVVSLGDGGNAVLTFAHPITNGPGPDFAVFENGFQSQAAPFEYYLELAFVEVSTDGKRFVRFPAVSLTQDTAQIDGFGQLNPEKIHNLAGKYVTDYGTPFDLQDIADSTGVDIDSINYIRIVDVVGDIHPAYARYDSQGHIINDPWPTPFWTGGFDLAGVGVIHEKQVTGTKYINKEKWIKLFPNPAQNVLILQSTKATPFIATVFAADGTKMADQESNGNELHLSVSSWPNGFYVVKIQQGKTLIIKKIIIRH